VALALAAPRSRAVLAVGAALVYLQWLPAVRAVGEAHGDPAARASFYGEVREVVGGARTEVVFTRGHWEAAHLAPHAPLARGWERQLDRKLNGLFYDDGLTAERYRAWLAENAVRYVALPAVALDYSAQAEAELLRGGIDGLREVHRTARWRIWAVEGVTSDARVVAADAFIVRGSGEVVTTQRWTRYWSPPAGVRLRRTAGGRVAVILGDRRDALVRAG
jgi:hypothetical protein